MHTILLSGGSGKRLWPLSNDARPKQFMKVLKDESGRLESMLMRTYRQLDKAGLSSQTVIAANETQVSAIWEQLGDKAVIVTEPERRNTFPAIMLSCAHLYYNLGLDMNSTVVVMPIDPYVDDTFIDTVKKTAEAADSYMADITLIGAVPTHPSTKYGYIIPEKYTMPNDTYGVVQAFKEKPDAEAAREFIMQGAFWNCGVFAFKLGYALDILARKIDSDNYNDVLKGYRNLEKTSFDYAVVENATKVSFIPYSGRWLDIGTWDSLTDIIGEKSIGEARIADSCSNVHVINELDIPIIVTGAKDLIIAAGKEGVLVTNREHSEEVKDYA